MNYRIKFARYLVLLIAVWPCCHLVLSFGGFISAWKFAGFGMYSKPSEEISISLDPCSFQEAGIVEPSGDEYLRVKKRILTNIAASAYLYNADALSPYLFEANKTQDCIRIDIHTTQISTDTYRWVESQLGSTYQTVNSRK